MPKAKYAGPQCQATVASDAAGKTVQVAVEVPSGGYELKLDRVVDRGPLSRIELTLVSPGEGEMVTMAFETKRSQAKLPVSCARAEVWISQEKRGLHYFKKPDYELASTLETAR